MPLPEMHTTQHRNDLGKLPESAITVSRDVKCELSAYSDTDLLHKRVPHPLEELRKKMNIWQMPSAPCMAQAISRPPSRRNPSCLR